MHTDKILFNIIIFTSFLGTDKSFHLQLSQKVGFAKRVMSAHSSMPKTEAWAFSNLSVVSIKDFYRRKCFLSYDYFSFSKCTHGKNWMYQEKHQEHKHGNLWAINVNTSLAPQYNIISRNGFRLGNIVNKLNIYYICFIYLLLFNNQNGYDRVIYRPLCTLVCSSLEKTDSSLPHDEIFSIGNSINGKTLIRQIT